MSNIFPPIPPWEGMHPIVVHFPVALLLVVPLGLLASLILVKGRRACILSVFALMVLGAGGAVLAVMSGDAGEKAAEAIPQARAVYEQHEELGELTRNIFLGLTALYALAVVAPALLKKEGKRVLQVGVSAVFLVLYLAGTTVLARAAHEGGRLVHEFGVRAPTGATPPPAAIDQGNANKHDDDDD